MVFMQRLCALRNNAALYELEAIQIQPSIVECVSFSQQHGILFAYF